MWLLDSWGLCRLSFARFRHMCISKLFCLGKFLLSLCHTCHEPLAKEYAPILISYARKDGNYLELEMLQRGLLGGVARLSQVSPHLVQNAVSHFMKYLKSIDPSARGLAAWLMGLLEATDARTALEALTDDDAEINIYQNGELINRCVNELAEEALKRLSVKPPEV